MNSSATSVFNNIISVCGESRANLDDRDTFNISYGVDKNYQLGVAISIISILENNRTLEKDFTFHIILDELEKEYIDTLYEIASKYGTVIKLYEIDSTSLKEFPHTDIWPISIYYRLVSFNYFSDKLDSLLYLDADIICKGKLDSLASLDLSGKYGAVVADVESMQNGSALRLNNERLNGKYFNSGVMLINMTKWLECRISDKAFSLLEDRDIVSRLKYPDQDILNILLLDNVILLPNIYNCIYPIKLEFEVKNKNYYKKIINDNTVFIHYTGVTKPWHDWADYPSAYYFRKIYEISPWGNQPYVKAKKIHEIKEKYKHQIYQGKYLLGILTNISYNYKKITNNK